MKAIFDTHVHFYQVTRPGGVPWPPAESGALYRDHLPADYEVVAKPAGVVGCIPVEASPLPEDTRFIEQLVDASPFYPGYVAAFAVDASDATERLAALVENPFVAGVRAFLWSGLIDLDHQQRALLSTLSRAGMTLDLISRKLKNPKAEIVRLLEAEPGLRVIIDHLGGAAGRAPAPDWVADMKRVAARPNGYVKLSAIFDMWNPGAHENDPWESPLDVDAYRPHFDVVFDAFGPDRVVFGSNWPVTEMSGSFADQIRIVETYLEPLGKSVRDRVMHDNGRRFYTRSS